MAKKNDMPARIKNLVYFKSKSNTTRNGSNVPSSLYNDKAKHNQVSIMLNMKWFKEWSCYRIIMLYMIDENIKYMWIGSKVSCS